VDWGPFDTSGGDTVLSAPYSVGGAFGLFCPPPGDAAYVPLTTGHQCLQVTVKDNGLNDQDPTPGTVKDPNGLGILGGITGSGKSTLAAAGYRYCQQTEPDRKITTLEDPIEFVLGRADDILPPTQLQIGRDVDSYANGIRAALRRAPSIIGIGEMRDFETFQAGVLAGQLGHFNLTTMHIHSPGEAIPRCLTMVPAEMREATARDLLGVLQYIVVQKLLRTTDGKRIAVREYIIFDDPLRTLLAGMQYTLWGQHIDTIIRQEKRRIADQAWQLFQSGTIERSELKMAMTSQQQRAFEGGIAA